MANITELQLQGDSTVHKLNDARITTTAVTNNTHILTTNSDVTSIAPITAANLASVLGAGFFKKKLYSNGDFNNIKTNAIVSVENCSTNNPSSMKYGVLFCSFDGDTGYQLYIPNSSDGYIYIRPYYSGSFYSWRQIPATIL